MRSPVKFFLLCLTLATGLFILSFTFSLMFHIPKQSMLQLPTGNYGTADNRTPPTPQAHCVYPSAARFNSVEDIFCMNLPRIEPRFKNPCFYELLGVGPGRPKRKLRCMPYFYLLGMDKCGTTDMHNRIMLHPNVRGNRGSLNKETQFWSWKRYGSVNIIQKKTCIFFFQLTD